MSIATEQSVKEFFDWYDKKKKELMKNRNIFFNFKEAVMMWQTIHDGDKNPYEGWTLELENYARNMDVMWKNELKYE